MKKSSKDIITEKRLGKLRPNMKKSFHMAEQNNNEKEKR